LVRAERQRQGLDGELDAGSAAAIAAILLRPTNPVAARRLRDLAQSKGGATDLKAA
jgi:hypothetical protein